MKKMIVGLLGVLALLLPVGASVFAEVVEVVNNKNQKESFEVLEETVLSEEGTFPASSQVTPDVVETVVSLSSLLPKNTPVLRTILGADDRTFVSNTSVYPYSAVCYLILTFSDGIRYGTGNIIGDRYVLTAAHNLYYKDLKEAVKSIEVIPAAYPKGSNAIGAPFGTARGVSYWVPEAWSKKFAYADDIGVLELDKDIGKKTGSFGVSTTVKETMTLTGFHVDKKMPVVGQPRMTTETGRKKDPKEEGIIHHSLDTFFGASGSGVYDPSTKLIFGVHAYGDVSLNSATQITSKWFNFISLFAKFKPVPIKLDKKVTVHKDSYPIWKSFIHWNQLTDTSDKVGKVYTAKYAYDHYNGRIYYSLYDSNNTWKGYINSEGVKELVADNFGKNVTISKNNYPIWSSFFFSNKKGESKDVMGKVYKAKYKYTLGNGVSYYSLYNGDDSWAGYINASAVKELVATSYNKDVKVAKTTYTIWGNFFFSNKKGNTSGKNGKVYKAKYTYILGNGAKYYSLYDASNTWLGYLNVEATTIARSLGNGEVIETNDFQGEEENLDLSEEEGD